MLNKWKAGKELAEIEITLKRIKNQYEETENVVEVVDNFQCHLTRISNMSKWQKQFIDVEILKLVNKEKGE